MEATAVIVKNFQYKNLLYKNFLPLVTSYITYNVVFIDQLTISVMHNSLVIGKGTTAQFTAIATGISRNKNSFVYQWIKRDSDSLPDKVADANGTVLTIPNVLESDEGQYYCIVTNEWGTRVESNDVTLSIFGMMKQYCKNLYNSNKYVVYTQDNYVHILLDFNV